MHLFLSLGSSLDMPLIHSSTLMVAFLSLISTMPYSLANAPHDQLQDYLHLPNTSQKVKNSCTQNLIHHYIVNDCLHPTYPTFALSNALPTSYHETLEILKWKAILDLGYHALERYDIWDLVPCQQCDLQMGLHFQIEFWLHGDSSQGLVGGKYEWVFI